MGCATENCVEKYYEGKNSVLLKSFLITRKKEGSEATAKEEDEARSFRDSSVGVVTRHMWCLYSTREIVVLPEIVVLLVIVLTTS